MFKETNKYCVTSMVVMVVELINICPSEVRDAFTRFSQGDLLHFFQREVSSNKVGGFVMV
jgi:hypothetical protein